MAAGTLTDRGVEVGGLAGRALLHGRGGGDGGDEREEDSEASHCDRCVYKGG